MNSNALNRVNIKVIKEIGEDNSFKCFYFEVENRWEQNLVLSLSLILFGEYTRGKRSKECLNKHVHITDKENDKIL